MKRSTASPLFARASALLACSAASLLSACGNPPLNEPARAPLVTGNPTDSPGAAATAPTPAPTPGVGYQPKYRLNEKNEWELVNEAPAGSDEARVAEARRFIAAGEPNKAINVLTPWLRENEVSAKPMVSAALLARGDAQTLAGDEFEALYDYEQILRFYPGSAEFPIAAERELEIGVRYLRGEWRRGWFGLRWVPATDVGTELLIRVQERLPGSRVAERAGIELGDYYYRTRELILAGQMYEIFAKIYPTSPYRIKALQRQIYANIARFKGPRYDASSLTDARVLIQRFMSLYPAQAQETGLDESLLNRIDESAGLQLLEVAGWYVQRNDEAGARFVLRRLVKEHPKSAAAQKALTVLKERGWGLGDVAAPEAASSNSTAAPAAATPAAPAAPTEKTR